MATGRDRRDSISPSCIEERGAKHHCHTTFLVSWGVIKGMTWIEKGNPEESRREAIIKSALGCLDCVLATTSLRISNGSWVFNKISSFLVGQRVNISWWPIAERAHISTSKLLHLCTSTTTKTYLYLNKNRVKSSSRFAKFSLREAPLVNKPISLEKYQSVVHKTYTQTFIQQKHGKIEDWVKTQSY